MDYKQSAAFQQWYHDTFMTEDDNTAPDLSYQQGTNQQAFFPTFIPPPPTYQTADYPSPVSSPVETTSRPVINLESPTSPGYNMPSQVYLQPSPVEDENIYQQTSPVDQETPYQHSSPVENQYQHSSPPQQDNNYQNQESYRHVSSEQSYSTPSPTVAAPELTPVVHPSPGQAPNYQQSSPGQSFQSLISQVDGHGIQSSSPPAQEYYQLPSSIEEQPNYPLPSSVEDQQQQATYQELSPDQKHHLLPSEQFSYPPFKPVIPDTTGYTTYQQQCYPAQIYATHHPTPTYPSSYRPPPTLSSRPSAPPTLNSQCVREKKRTEFRGENLRILEEAFAQCDFARGSRKQELANMLGVSVRTITVWYQNKRAKLRKERKRREMLETAAKTGRNRPKQPIMNQSRDWLSANQGPVVPDSVGS
eukprot:sb/3465092/